MFGESISTTSAVQIRRGAKALILRDGQVLLVRERRSDGTEFWGLPGGGVRPDETLTSALHRELDEELGCGLEVGSHVARCVYRHRSDRDTVSVYAVFQGELANEPSPNPETGVIDASWVSPPRLPPKTLPPFRALLEERAPPRSTDEERRPARSDPR